MADTSNGQVEDIFAEADSSGTQPRAPQKKKPPKKSVRLAPPRQPRGDVQSLTTRPRYRKSRIMLIILLTAGAVTILGGGAILVTSGVFSNENSALNLNTSTTITTNIEPSSTTNTVVNTTITVQLTKPDPGSLPVDTDRDGLTDDEEEELGTDRNKIDTDGDGLFDREEVKVYGTNPLKSDTDGDGNEDGAEVANGFDPAGSGQLLDLDAAINKLRS